MIIKKLQIEHANNNEPKNHIIYIFNSFFFFSTCLQN
uniref:Uncharacterized protein At2g35870 n=1 Tax=Arabidopsis thaliana TaxID=3702 RepID=Q9SJ63_ARATH|nr:unknown protein [Arabidopsis thaliana]